MNELELSTLFLEHTTAVVEVMFGYLSLVSAFLAATYLAGKEISKLLAGVVVGLFCFASALLIAIVSRYMATAISIQGELVKLGVEWHPAVTEPAFVLPTLGWAVPGCMLLITLTSLWYFLSTRRTKRGWKKTTRA